MSSSLNSRIVDLVAPRARQTALPSERRRALLLALAGLPFAARPMTYNSRLAQELGPRRWKRATGTFP